ncbi:hypothetical protein [Morganella morganii]|uniref:hypothetical protein n=1 Tax=Morganella morganii TaxID=582 RepID=UPI00062C157C|nr:hypothetical protein [Morganella morganii]BEP21599.1 hypothetical protein SUGSMm_23960 [Morganella morganii subsp. sibonii]HDS6844720.1 hypothetical protein [Morganella morganii subsp. morganii]EGT3624630.1 hypothetical protein [Morganella morganii]EGT3630647.1 hypothetical protein [Morganella morganii]EGT3634982.1 hypothetical protein [Morganella morganii]
MTDNDDMREYPEFSPEVEAIAQCNQIRDMLVAALEKRNKEMQRLRKKTEEIQREFPGDLKKLQAHMREMKDSNNEVMTLVREYNVWAERAGQDKLVLE